VSLTAQIIQNLALLRSSGTGNNLTQERQWLLNQLDDPRLQEAVATLSIVALHTLSALEKGEQTGIELASELGVTRGGITRAAKKLVQLDLVDPARHPDDQKKLFYRLTPAGRKIARQHDKLHEELTEKFEKELTGQYSEQELNLINDFLTKLNKDEAEF
jgi:DNA-binding MarR family transcriptional regulator